MGYKEDKSAARQPEGSLVETRCLKGPKSAIVPFAEPRSGPKSKTSSGVFFGNNSPNVARVALGLQSNIISLWKSPLYIENRDDTTAERILSILKRSRYGALPLDSLLSYQDNCWRTRALPPDFLCHIKILFEGQQPYDQMF